MASIYAFLNVRGFTSKIEEIRLMLDQQRVSILFLAETFLNKHDGDSIHDMPNYQLVRRDRGYGYGGGLLAYVHSSVQFEHLTELDNIMPESLNIKVKPRAQKSFLDQIGSTKLMGFLKSVSPSMKKCLFSGFLI